MWKDENGRKCPSETGFVPGLCLQGSWAGMSPARLGAGGMGVSLGATPGALVHDPSAEEVLQPLIQAGGHPVLLACPRHGHLLGGKSSRESHPGQEGPPVHSGPSPLAWTGFSWPHGNVDFSPPGNLLSLAALTTTPATVWQTDFLSVTRSSSHPNWSVSLLVACQGPCHLPQGWGSAPGL